MRAVSATSIIALSLAIAVTGAGAHAFPERSEPRVGAVVRAAPTEVRVWFDGNIEPSFSKLTVADAAGRRVDRDDAHVDPRNQRLLQVGLPPLQPGVYTVTWSVLAVDGHRTQGDFKFTLKPPE